jgi:hypothetical protein
MSMNTHQVKSDIISIFNIREWTSTQHDLYNLLKQYVDNFKDENHKYEMRDDKNIIRNNFKEQSWYKYSKSKPIIGHLVDQMELTNYMYDQNDHSVHLDITLSFDHFHISCCLYKNTSNNYVDYYLFIENNRHLKAYITYYTSPIDNDFHSKLKKLKLPEFDKLYQIIDINQSILYQGDLLNFIAELILYYDPSETIGNMPISNDLNVTLNQLIEKFNTYNDKKHTEIDYKIVS